MGSVSLLLTLFAAIVDFLATWANLEINSFFSLLYSASTTFQWRFFRLFNTIILVEMASLTLIVTEPRYVGCLVINTLTKSIDNDLVLWEHFLVKFKSSQNSAQRVFQHLVTLEALRVNALADDQESEGVNDKWQEISHISFGFEIGLLVLKQLVRGHDVHDIQKFLNDARLLHLFNHTVLVLRKDDDIDESLSQMCQGTESQILIIYFGALVVLEGHIRLFNDLLKFVPNADLDDVADSKFELLHIK